MAEDDSESSQRAIMYDDEDKAEKTQRILVGVAAINLKKLKHRLSELNLLPRISEKVSIGDPPRQYGIVTRYLIDDLEQLSTAGDTLLWRARQDKNARLENSLHIQTMLEGVESWRKMMGDRIFYDWDGVMRGKGIGPEQLLERLEANIPKSGLKVINLAKELGIDVPRRHAYAFYVVPVNAEPGEIANLARAYAPRSSRSFSGRIKQRNLSSP